MNILKNCVRMSCRYCMEASIKTVMEFHCGLLGRYSIAVFYKIITNVWLLRAAMNWVFLTTKVYFWNQTNLVLLKIILFSEYQIGGANFIVNI